MDPIEQVVELLNGHWVEQLLGGATIVMAIWTVFIGIQIGKRLLRIAAGGHDEGTCATCGADWGGDPEDWEEGFMCSECLYEYGEPEDRMAAEGMSADEIDREMYPSFYEGEGQDDEAGKYGVYHELLDSDDAEAAKAYAEAEGLDVDWHKHTLELIQDVIDRGDFALADDMCNEAGIDKLELDWH